MSSEEILEYVKGHPYVRVKIDNTDIEGILLGKYISAEKFLSIASGGSGFCDVIFGWDAADLALVAGDGRAATRREEDQIEQGQRATDGDGDDQQQREIDRHRP